MVAVWIPCCSPHSHARRLSLARNTSWVRSCRALGWTNNRPAIFSWSPLGFSIAFHNTFAYVLPSQDAMC